MLRRAKQTKRQIIEQLNRRVLKETTLSKKFQDKGMGKTPLGEEENSNSRQSKLISSLQNLVTSEGFTVAEILKAIKFGLTPQIKVNDTYVMGNPDSEKEWIPNESEQKNIDSFNEPERWENLKIVTDKFGNSVKTRTIEDGSQLFEYPDGSWGFNDPREDEEDDINFRQTGRRYDDRVNYGTDDESRYDDRNYQYGNNPDDDLNEDEELPTVRREDSDRLRRKPYSAKARFRAGLGKSL